MRIWTVTFDQVALAAAQDLFDLVPATDKPITLMGFELSNVGGTADAGDSQEELLPLQVIRGLATVGSAGAAATPVPVDGVHSDTAGFTARVNDTTVAVVGAGRTDRLLSTGMNVRVGYQNPWPPEWWVKCTAAAGQTRLVVRLAAAPADSITFSGTAWVGEG